MQCFVIQPFDSGKFDKRFEDVYRLAIEDAGLEAYRVDEILLPGVPIESIERGIKRAAVCLADITVDIRMFGTTNFAYAIGKPVVLVCSAERAEKGSLLIFNTALSSNIARMPQVILSNYGRGLQVVLRPS